MITFRLLGHKTAEAQQLILDELAKRFGGAAADDANTTAGAWDRMANAASAPGPHTFVLPMLKAKVVMANAANPKGAGSAARCTTGADARGVPPPATD